MTTITNFQNKTQPNKLQGHNPDQKTVKLPLDGVFHRKTSGTGYARVPRYKAWRTRTATALWEAGLEDEARLFDGCSEKPHSKVKMTVPHLHPNATTVWACTHDPDHDAHQFFPTCDLRICPDCAHRQLARFAKRLVPVVSEYAVKKGRYRLRHIVLTTPLSLASDDCPEQYRQYWKAVAKLWTMLHKDNPYYETKGTIESAEFGTQGHKLHFHVFHYGTYIAQKAISEAWYSLTGQKASVVHVRGLTKQNDDQLHNDVIETLKYSVKFWSKDENGYIKYVDPELMPNLVRTLKGTRRVRTRGVFYKIPPIEDDPLCCDTCGHEMVRIGVEHWQIWLETGYTPKEYAALFSDDPLNLKLANKSPPKHGRTARGSPQPGQIALFDLNEYTKKASDHYQREDDRTSRNKK